MSLDALLRRYHKQGNPEGGPRKPHLVKMFHNQNGQCYLCGCQMTLRIGEPHTATIDHVIPKSRVLNREAFYMHPGTRKAACWTCNNKKGDSVKWRPAT